MSTPPSYNYFFLFFLHKQNNKTPIMDDATMTHFFIKHHINIITIVYIGYVKEEVVEEEEEEVC